MGTAVLGKEEGTTGYLADHHEEHDGEHNRADH